MENSRTVSWWMICALIVAHAIWTTAVNLGFQARVPLLDTLSANLLGLAVIVGGLLFALGALRPRDVGLVRSKLLPGIVFTLAFVALSQTILAAIAAIPDDGVRVVNAWAARSAPVLVYVLCAQLFGNALYEEIVFRGFLLRQLASKFRSLGPRTGLGLALLASQGLFALAHIPNRLWVSNQPAAELPGALLMLLVMGSLFAAVYLLTDNLFATVGMHAFVNVQMLQLTSAGGSLDLLTAAVVWVSAVLLAIGWRWTRAWRRDRPRRAWHT